MTPTTDAGKRLLGNIVVEDLDDAEWSFPLDPAAAIAEIEAEARTAALTALRERVEAHGTTTSQWIEGHEEMRAAVLAEIDRMLGGA